MSLRESVTEDVKNSGNNESDEQETLEQIEVDFGSTPFIKFYPTTLISGTIPADEGNPIIRFPDAQHNEGRKDQGYLGLVLDDVSIDTSDDTGFDMTEAKIVETDDEDYTEYRAVNYNDSQTADKFDGQAVSISGDQYGIENQTTEIDGRAILVIDRTAAMSVARTLDVNGATYAGMDEETGRVNGGLIEYAPDGADAEVGSRYARNPELREELYGEEVSVLVTRRSEVDDDYAELVADESNDVGDMMWYTVVGPSGDKLSPVEGEPTGYTYLEWRFDPSAGNLPDEDYEFVQEYVEAGAPTDEETILQNIEDNAGELSDEPDTERMVGLIQAEAGA